LVNSHEADSVKVTGGKLTVIVGPVSVTVEGNPGGVKTVRSQAVTVAPGVSTVMVLPGPNSVTVVGGKTGPEIVQSETVEAGTSTRTVCTGG
jgi:hypothetical protein